MLTGIFWSDNGRRLNLDGLVAMAAASYRIRFHREPTLLLVPPGTIRGGASTVGAVTVRSHALLPPHYFWIGTDEPASRPRSFLEVRHGSARSGP